MAIQFIAQNAGGLFKATANECRLPFVNGNANGSLTPEQLALPGAVGNPMVSLGTAAIITGGLAAPALFAISGTPIFSSSGVFGSAMWASSAGTALINAGAQYYQNGTINPIDVALAAASGGAGAYGGLLWNMGVNAAGGATGTAINNYFNAQSNSVVGSALASGTFSSVGYGAGKFLQSQITSAMRPTINNVNNWVGTGGWSSGGYNLFRPNYGPAIGATAGGGAFQEAVQGTFNRDKK